MCFLGGVFGLMGEEGRGRALRTTGGKAEGCGGGGEKRREGARSRLGDYGGGRLFGFV